MTLAPLTNSEWDRLCYLRSITAAGGTLNTAEALACEELAKRIRIPVPAPVQKPGVPPPTVPIAQPPNDAKSIA